MGASTKLLTLDYKDNSRALVARFNLTQKRKMQRCAHHVWLTARQLVNRPNPTGLKPSRPGEPPKKVSGVGQASIMKESTDRTFRIVVAKRGFYMYLLNRGTMRVAARPWMKKAIERSKKKLHEIIGEKVF